MNRMIRKGVPRSNSKMFSRTTEQNVYPRADIVLPNQNTKVYQYKSVSDAVQLFKSINWRIECDKVNVLDESKSRLRSPEISFWPDKRRDIGFWTRDGYLFEALLYAPDCNKLLGIFKNPFVFEWRTFRPIQEPFAIELLEDFLTLDERDVPQWANNHSLLAGSTHRTRKGVSPRI